jgi:hypothetical protein
MVYIGNMITSKYGMRFVGCGNINHTLGEISDRLYIGKWKMKIKCRDSYDVFNKYNESVIILFATGFAKKGHRIVNMANWGKLKIENEIFNYFDWLARFRKNNFD